MHVIFTPKKRNSNLPIFANNIYITIFLAYVLCMLLLGTITLKQQDTAAEVYFKPRRFFNKHSNIDIFQMP